MRSKIEIALSRLRKTGGAAEYLERRVKSFIKGERHFGCEDTDGYETIEFHAEQEWGREQSGVTDDTTPIAPTTECQAAEIVGSCMATEAGTKGPAEGKPIAKEESDRDAAEADNGTGPVEEMECKIAQAMEAEERDLEQELQDFEDWLNWNSQSPASKTSRDEEAAEISGEENTQK